MENRPDISIVVPLLNEEESLPELHAWIQRVMQENNWSYEIIFVDDGSRDNSWKVIAGLGAKDPNVKGIRFRRNYGKSVILGIQLFLAGFIGELISRNASERNVYLIRDKLNIKQ